METCKNNNKKRIRRTDEELAAEALLYTSKVDFQNKSNAYYKQAWRKGPEFLNKICSHMPVLWGPKWETIEEIQIEAYKYPSRTSFAKGSAGAYDKAQRMGWLDTVCAFMGQKCNEAYTIEEIAKIALKYSNKEDFRNNDCGAFSAAHKMEIVEQICSHMEVLWEPKWNTKEKIQMDALKYTYRTAFKIGSSGAWDAAVRLGILGEVCSHMKRSRSTSSAEKELLLTLKKNFNSIKKMVDRKIKIENKPYIRRFEIDMFVSELNLGIEFDGDYHHSFEGLKRGRKHWPVEDVRAYHQIKDTWFLSKGIQILHIKESDWKKDKESCIKRCLDFLGGQDVKAL